MSDTYRLSYQDKMHEFSSLAEAQNFLDSLPSRAGVEILDAPLLFTYLNAPGAPITNWREIISEVDNEWKTAGTTDHRVALLAAFKATMDIAETTIAPDDLQKFRDAREKHYKSFIVEETLVGQNVCTETLDAVTRREVEAGRMSANDPLRKGAEAAMAEPHLSRAELEVIARQQDEKRSGFWSRTFGKLFRG